MYLNTCNSYNGKIRIKLSYLILPMCFILLNTSTKLLKFNKLYQLIFASIALIFIMTNHSTFKKMYLQQKIWLVICFYCTFGLLITTDFSSTLSFYISFITFTLILYLKAKKVFFESLLNVLSAFLFIGAISIYLNILIPDLMTNYLSKLVIDSVLDVLIKDVSAGVYSGFFADRASAAFAMNLGFIISYSEYILYGKNNDMFKSGIYMIAILFTGKRALALIPVVIIFTSLLLSKRLNRFNRNIVRFMVVATAALFVVLSIVPQADLVVLRFLNASQTGDIWNSRTTILWPVAYAMFDKNRIFGVGLNTFNHYIQMWSFGEPTLSVWEYHAHNIYIQLLSETGIIGFLLFITMFAVCLIKSMHLFRKVNDKELQNMLYVSVFIQIMWLIYGVTGNTFYYTPQLFCYLIAIAMMSMVEHEVRKIE